MYVQSSPIAAVMLVFMIVMDAGIIEFLNYSFQNSGFEKTGVFSTYRLTKEKALDFCPELFWKRNNIT